MKILTLLITSNPILTQLQKLVIILHQASNMKKLRTMIQVRDTASENLGIEDKDIIVPIVLDLNKITAHRPEVSDESLYGEDPKYNGSIIYMNNGDRFWITMDFYKLDNLIQDTDA